MKKILKKPLLPQSRATVALSEDNREIIGALNQLGIDTFPVPKNPDMEPSICSHADCNILQLDEKNFVCSEHLQNKLKYFIKELETVNFITKINENVNIYTEKIFSPYPNDVKLNVKILGNRIVCNTKSVSSAIVDFARQQNYKLIHCNQGYVGCSSVLVAPNAVMTDDESVFKSFHQIGFDCLMLSKGQIKLSGYSYGFIGGCCGFIDKSTLVFTGKIDSHTDSKKIKKFLDKYNVNALELTKNCLTDIGGIIPILEEN